MRMYDLIYKKKNGKALTDDEIRFIVDGYVDGSIPDYQMSAFAMAVCFSSMNSSEIAVLTDAMAKSGDELDLSVFENRTVDKHSTGGVGDKTTIIVAPLAATMGAVVAKLSGRGLGHTGGTIDKLESIPGFNCELSTDQFMKIAKEHSIVVSGATGNFAVADKKLYALRDVTATVDCIPLIASSIMSKKLAAGAKNIVLDVKSGTGAFMRTTEDAKELAQTMVDIGKHCKRNMCAVLTDMNVPLGCAIGNAVEVIEAVEILKGNGPEDLRDVAITLASRMVALMNGCNAKSVTEQAEEALKSGKALEVFREWIVAQGGDDSFVDDFSKLPTAKLHHEVKAKSNGYIFSMETAEIGEVSCILGAGRKTKDDSIDPACGIILSKKTGDYVKIGDTIATLLTNDEASIKQAEERFLDAISISDCQPKKVPHIIEIIE